MRVERSKMCRATWEALKVHIMRDRKRKRDEMEADAEEARQRLKREQLKKQHKSTLQDTIQETAQLETRLQQLKEEKHEMFLKLKKVLNEDETRRRQQLMKDAQASQAAHGPPPALQPVVLQPAISQHGTGRITLNKMAAHHPSLLQMGVKRQRSPSPPPPHQPAYRHEYLYKGQPMPALGYGGLPSAPPHVSAAAVARDDSHHPVYMAQSRPMAGYGMASHSVLDSSREKAEFYGGAPHRAPGHMAGRPAPLPVQPPPPQGGKAGSITSGYPVRSVGPGGAYPPASVNGTAVPTSRQPPPSHQGPPRFYN